MQVNETLKNFINEAADKAFALVRESHPRAEFVKEYETQVRCGDCFMLCSFAESAGIAIPEELRAKYEERKQRKAQAQGWAAGETKTTVRAFLEAYNDQDADVGDDYADDFEIAYCGDQLTEAGKALFADILDLPITIYNNAKEHYLCATVHVETEEQHELVKRLFVSAAGYCDDSEYSKLFKED